MLNFLMKLIYHLSEMSRAKLNEVSQNQETSHLQLSPIVTNFWSSTSVDSWLSFLIWILFSKTWAVCYWTRVAHILMRILKYSVNNFCDFLFFWWIARYTKNWKWCVNVCPPRCKVCWTSLQHECDIFPEYALQAE